MEIWFDGLGSRTHFGMLTGSREIEPPSPRLYTVTVPGRDGTLDLSEACGRLNYEDRKAVYTFFLPEDAEWTALELRHRLHGHRVKIFDEALPEYYLVGRVSVGKMTGRGGWGILKLTCDCEPFYYAARETVVTAALSAAGSLTKTVYNTGSIPAAASLTVTGAAWTVNGTAYTAGSYPAALTIEPGENTLALSCAGAGTLSLAFRKAVL